MEKLEKVDILVIHHSEREEDSAEFIRERHLKRGFEDIGYHYLIDEKGNLFFGRSIEFCGAHVYGHNTNSLGICLMGNFDKKNPSKIQMNKLVLFIKDLLKKYNLSPEKVLGHREFKGVTKSCPGKFVNMEELRRKLLN